MSTKSKAHKPTVVAPVVTAPATTTWKSTLLSSSCHTGNTIVGTINKGGTFYCGGWSRGAKPELSWAVIDLAGTFYRPAPKASAPGFEKTLAMLDEKAGPVLNLFIQDFGVPTWKPEVWDVLSFEVKALLEAGTNVLVACTGGHGRTGMVVAILGKLLGFCDQDDPIKWIRKIHCEEAVETWEQEEYVYKTLGMQSPARPIRQPAYKSIWGEYWKDGKYVGKPVAESAALVQGSHKSSKDCRYCGILLDPIYGDDLDRGLCKQCLDMNDEKNADVPLYDLGTCIYCGQSMQEGDYLKENLCKMCHNEMAEKGISLV
jgi:hypothetical protein